MGKLTEMVEAVKLLGWGRAGSTTPQWAGMRMRVSHLKTM